MDRWADEVERREAEAGAGNLHLFRLFPVWGLNPRVWRKVPQFLHLLSADWKGERESGVRDPR